MPGPGRLAEYQGGLTNYVMAVAVVAAIGGVMFGYDIVSLPELPWLSMTALHSAFMQPAGTALGAPYAGAAAWMSRRQGPPCWLSGDRLGCCSLSDPTHPDQVGPGSLPAAGRGGRG